MIDALLYQAVKHLTTFDALLALVVILTLLGHRRQSLVVWWGISAALTVIFSLVFSRLGSALYVDHRTYTAVHFGPLAPLSPLFPHSAHNSFPSGHSVLTALIVAIVFLLNRRWAIPFVVLGLLDDWVRVGLSAHRAIDIGGGWVFVAIATALAIPTGAVIAAVLLPLASTAGPASMRGLRQLSRLGHACVFGLSARGSRARARARANQR
ncbi:MAG: phosphatase PAP2 family protein [Chloroflexota bacterium]